jgi:hypothetical protein
MWLWLFAVGLILAVAVSGDLGWSAIQSGLIWLMVMLIVIGQLAGLIEAC